MIVQDRLVRPVSRYLVLYQAVQNAPQGHCLEKKVEAAGQRHYAHAYFHAHFDLAAQTGCQAEIPGLDEDLLDPTPQLLIQAEAGHCEGLSGNPHSEEEVGLAG